MIKLTRTAIGLCLAIAAQARSQDFVVLPSPYGGYCADLDGDGLEDSLSWAGDDLFGGHPTGVSVHHGLGNGLLGPAQFVDCPGGTFLLAGDTMGDGLPDIISLTAATATTPPQFVVVPNTPGTGFGEAVLSASSIIVAKLLPGSTVGYTNRETIADMDGDGLDDLVVDVYDDASPSSTWRLTVCRSTGSSQFQETASLPVPGIQFVVGDFNADGQLDAVTVRSDGTLLHHAAEGGGQLSATAMPSMIVAPWFAFGSCITGADFDQDGLLDIAATGSASTSAGGGVAVIMRGSGNGSFDASSIRYVLSPSISAQGDLNGDGWPDLVLGVNPGFGAEQPAPGISTCLNDGAGGLLPEVVTDMDVSVSQSGTEFAVRDLDGDGLADVGLSFILSGKGDGTFVHRQVLRVGEAHPNLIAAGDLDSDGALDLVGTLDLTQEPVTIRLGHGDGTFDDGIEPAIAGNAYELAIADLNTDDVPDLILDQGLDPGLLTANLGLGNGTMFLPAVPIAAVDAADIGVADVDGNSTLDVVVTRQGKVDAWVMLGNGAGQFSAPLTVALGGKGSGLALSDLDGDGTVDIVTPLTASKHLSLVLGTGSGAFAPPQLLTQNFAANHVAVADFNEDGLSDLALANKFQNTTLFLAVSPAVFGSPVEIENLGNFNDIGTADLDRDGHVDIVGNGLGVSFIRGLGDGTFGETRLHESSGGSSGLALGDFNSDAFVDVAVAESSEKSLSVLLNRAATLPSLGYQHDAGSGFPYLTGAGSTVPGSEVSLQATAVAGIGTGVLVVGLEFAPHPFKGGVLVPSADGLVPYQAPSILTGRWPAVPAGTPLYLQAWFPTSLGESTASNAVVGITH